MDWRSEEHPPPCLGARIKNLVVSMNTSMVSADIYLVSADTSLVSLARAKLHWVHAF